MAGVVDEVVAVTARGSMAAPAIRATRKRSLTVTGLPVKAASMSPAARS